MGNVTIETGLGAYNPYAFTQPKDPWATPSIVTQVQAGINASQDAYRKQAEFDYKKSLDDQRAQDVAAITAQHTRNTAAAKVATTPTWWKSATLNSKGSILTVQTSSGPVEVEVPPGGGSTTVGTPLGEVTVRNPGKNNEIFVDGRSISPGGTIQGNVQGYASDTSPSPAGQSKSQAILAAAQAQGSTTQATPVAAPGMTMTVAAPGMTMKTKLLIGIGAASVLTGAFLLLRGKRSGGAVAGLRQRRKARRNR
ncbi:MAG: hypothetical protein Q7R39_05900 [Dehalococcoidia bacterium]|nr:hypothetical protein [Dehalococcoidia bacterium]